MAASQAEDFIDIVRNATVSKILCLGPFLRKVMKWGPSLANTYVSFALSILIAACKHGA